MDLINGKGFAFSPFMLIFLVFMGVSLYLYFTDIDTMMSRGVLIEGGINSAIIDVESVRLLMNEYALFSGYQGLYEVGKNGGNSDDLEDSIQDLMNKYIENYTPEKGVAVNGNFSVFVQKEKGGYLSIHTDKAPIAFMNRSDIMINTSLGIERFVDFRFFLLMNFSDNFNESSLAALFTNKFLELIDDKFNISNVSISELNDAIIINGDARDSDGMNNGSLITGIIEDALVGVENNTNVFYSEITDKGCALILKPNLIVVDVEKFIIDDKTTWFWNISMRINASIYDFSHLENYSDGIFNVTVEKGLILRDRGIEPFEYRMDKIYLAYNINLNISEQDTRDPLDYTEEMFKGDSHKPQYSLREEWII